MYLRRSWDGELEQELNGRAYSVTKGCMIVCPKIMENIKKQLKMNHCLRFSERRIEHFSDSKISEFDNVVLGEEHILATGAMHTDSVKIQGTGGAGYVCMCVTEVGGQAGGWWHG